METSARETSCRGVRFRTRENLNRVKRGILGGVSSSGRSDLDLTGHGLSLVSPFSHELDQTVRSVDRGDGLVHTCKLSIDDDVLELLEVEAFDSERGRLSNLSHNFGSVAHAGHGCVDVYAGLVHETPCAYRHGDITDSERAQLAKRVDLDAPGVTRLELERDSLDHLPLLIEDLRGLTAPSVHRILERSLSGRSERAELLLRSERQRRFMRRAPRLTVYEALRPSQAL